MFGQNTCINKLVQYLDYALPDFAAAAAFDALQS